MSVIAINSKWQRKAYHIIYFFGAAFGAAFAAAFGASAFGAAAVLAAAFGAAAATFGDAAGVAAALAGVAAAAGLATTGACTSTGLAATFAATTGALAAAGLASLVAGAAFLLLALAYRKLRTNLGSTYHIIISFISISISICIFRAVGNDRVHHLLSSTNEHTEHTRELNQSPLLTIMWLYLATLSPLLMVSLK
jgi:hypothetical protein